MTDVMVVEIQEPGQTLIEVSELLDEIVVEVVESESISVFIGEVTGPMGPPGPQGTAGDGFRFRGTGPPGLIPGVIAGDAYLDLSNGDIYRFED